MSNDFFEFVTAQDEAADEFDRKKYDIAEHIKSMFGMYGGEVVSATLSFEDRLINAALDHFGQDTIFTAKTIGWVVVNTDVSVSPVFLAWMFQFGKRAKIVAPDSLVEAMRKLVKENADMYHE
jgi:predicted DNA-binding transcriptional regulator YafY